MKNIVEIATQMVESTTSISGRTEADLEQLRGHRETTTTWNAQLSSLYGDLMFGCPGTARITETQNQGEREAAYSVWLDRLLSGEPGDSFWAETAMIGLLHARAGVDNRHLLALSSRIEQEFLTLCIRDIPEGESLATYFAFSRLTATANGLMVDSYTTALSAGMDGLGVKPRLAKRAQDLGIRDMIEDARGALPLIEWSDAISVGIDAIDDQHKVLIELINRLHQASAGKSDKAVLRKILGDLVDYTVEHFKFEEDFMTQSEYPGYEQHKAAHVALVGQVTDLVAAFDAGKAKLGGEVFQFLRSWLNGHIRGTDRRYSKHFLEHGMR